MIVRAPAARFNLIRAMADWGDLEFQRRSWIGSEYPEMSWAAPYYSVDEFFEISWMAPKAHRAIGWSLVSRERARCQRLADVLGPFMNDGSSAGDDASMLADPRWPDIVSACRKALPLLVLGGGTISIDLVPSRSATVEQPAARNTVAHALASVAESTCWPTDEYTDEDAPAYLLPPEQVIDALLTIGHLDDPRSQIDVIYRDTYEEIPRLERVHDSVIRYQANEITLADLADPAVDALCSVIRSGAGWDLNPDELAAARQRTSET